MSPRRSRFLYLESKRPVRRGRIPAPTGKALAVVNGPAGTYTNGLTGPGSTVRLVDVNGAPLAQPGVTVTVRLPNGAGATLTSLPAQAITDATGVATFTSHTITGQAGSTSLIYEATGYIALTVGGVLVVAADAVASTSTAQVPSGQVNTPTVIQITLRDASGNPLQVAGSGTVTVQITGANSRASQTVPFVAGTGYQYSYTPATAGTDSVAVRYAGTHVSGSPYTSVVSGSGGGIITGNSLRYGLWASYPEIGKGPTWNGSAWTTAAPIWPVVLDAIPAAQINAAIAAADAANVTIVHLIAGGKQTYSDVSGDLWIYNDADFRANVNAYAGNPTYTDALARRRVIILVIDEPWISKTVGSFTPAVCRDMFRYIKGIWPNSITCSRFEPNFIVGTSVWTNVAIPAGYFDKLDYSWATYRGPDKTPSTGMTFAQWVAYARPFNAANGYGTIWGCNWWNLGDSKRCWDAAGTGVSGRRHGPDADTGGGTFVPCATPDSERFWVMGDTEHQDYLAAILADVAQTPGDLAPFWLDWTHAGLASGLSHAPIARTIETQANMVTMFKQMITGGAARSAQFQWRTPK